MSAASGAAGRAPRVAAEEETAVVTGLTHEGEGVVHGGKTVFVAGALPGEQIRFRRTRRHRQHDDGELLEVLQPAAERVVPHCPHFGVCGGCALQHLSAAAQLAAKEQELRETLSRVARLAPARWLAPLTGPQWGYRRRARLGAKFVHRKGTVVVGFRERAAPYVAQLHSCAVLAPPAGELIAPLAAMLSGLSIREHLPQIEVAVADNATALVLRVLRTPSAEDAAQLAAFAAAHRLRLYLQPAGLDSVHELAPGAAALHYRLPRFDVELQFAPTDFIQVNGPVNAALVQRAVELLEPTPAAMVLDLYCGLGNFSLPLARRAAQVWSASRATRRCSSAPAATRGITASATPSSTTPTSPPCPRQRCRGCGTAIPTCCSTPHARARARCSRRWRGSRRSGCCIFPAIRGVWRAIWGCWCTSTALRSQRPVWSTCFRTPRMSNRWRC